MSLRGDTMNNFDFIEQIHTRLPLWDKTHDTDVTTKEDLWDEVAQAMECSKDILKSRWKNLRDTYRKIIKKNGGRDADSKWPYFHAMEFMREITASSRSKVTDITTKAPAIEADYSLTLVQSENDVRIDPLSEDHEDMKRGVKREAGEDLVTHFLEIEDEKSNGESTDKCTRHQSDDDDCQFLLSLLPHFKQVAINRKLPLRMKIEQLIYDEVYRSSY